uniref:Homeobox domain-containing protein n=1 Tax=Gasterosteus aculeatus aculeatus TaxID=481459 RepID=A0AAQ4QQA3_GASAC
MSSYFVNSTFPVTLPGTGAGGQSAESFLGQIPLYSSGYAADHPLRHYSGAAAVSAAATAYGASSGVVHQEKPYPAPSYYQQAANGAYGAHRAAQGVVGAGACDYAVAAAAAAAAATSFYRDKEHACTLEEHQLAMSQEGMHRKVECAGLSGKGVFGETMDDKLPSSAPIYPWMQRMNSCNGSSCWCFACQLPFYYLTWSLYCLFITEQGPSAAPGGADGKRTRATRRSSWRRSSTSTGTSRGGDASRSRTRSASRSGRLRSGSRTGG